MAKKKPKNPKGRRPVQGKENQSKSNGVTAPDGKGTSNTTPAFLALEREKTAEEITASREKNVRKRQIKKKKKATAEFHKDIIALGLPTARDAAAPPVARPIAGDAPLPAPTEVGMSPKYEFDPNKFGLIPENTPRIRFRVRSRYHPATGFGDRAEYEAWVRERSHYLDTIADRRVDLLNPHRVYNLPYKAS
jgi:hypothetical protein